MKLLMISTDRNIFDKGSTVALRQIEYAKKYEEVHIIVFADKKFTEISLGQNIFVYPTRSSSKWFYVFDALKLGRFIVEKRAINMVTCQDPFETGLVGALVKSRHPLELELQIHTDIGSPYFQNFTFLNKIRTLILKYTLPRADTVRVVSERIKKYVGRFTDESKITVRPIAVDVEKIKNAPVITDLRAKYPQFSKIVLMASRFEPEKNISMALEAFKIVLEKNPFGKNKLGKNQEVGLVIVGSGSEEMKLKSLAQKLCIEKSAIFEGWQKDLASYYKTADLFLVTSWYEGYGMTFVEAQAVGCSIISTDVGIAKEIGSTIVKHIPSDIAHGIMMKI